MKGRIHKNLVRFKLKVPGFILMKGIVTFNGYGFDIPSHRYGWHLRFNPQHTDRKAGMFRKA